MEPLDMLASIPLTPYPSLEPMKALSALLSTQRGPWPTFELLCCYAKLWKHLPEDTKAGRSATDTALLNHVSRQIKATYSDLVFLLPCSDSIAICDASSPGSITHRRVSAFVRSFSLPITKTTSLKPVVALALPNGPLLGLAILAVTAYYTAAPMTITSGGEQFKSDILQSGAKTILAVKADITRLGLHEIWVRHNGISVVLLDMNADMTFDMTHIDESPVVPHMGHTPNGPDDFALVLFTSGTSGKKKIVPYTVHTLVAGIGFVIESWGLTADDACLNMMPLFHV